LQLLPRLGTILHDGAHLVEQVQALVDFLLRVGRIGPLLGSDSLSCDTRIAGIVGTIALAITTAGSRIPRSARDAVSDRTRQASALITLAAAGLATLATLPLTRLLAAAAALLTALLALTLPLALALTLSGLTVLRLLLPGLATALSSLPVAG
jgi:hypothetical protein